MRAKHITGDFERFFEGAKTFEPQIVLSAAKGKITSHTIRISGALLFLCIGATIRSKNVGFIVGYRFLIVLKMFWKCRKCAKTIEKIRKNSKVRAFVKKLFPL
jgi:hypothetical protein